GATILDIGGQSTRPGSVQLGPEEEWSRLKDIVPELVSAFPETYFSIDTYYGKVAEKAMQAGFHLVNDVSAFEDDPQMFEFLKHYKPAYIMMHKKGRIENMQVNPFYENVVIEILNYFQSRMALLNEIGVYDIVLDPGFGFGKNLQHNLEILKSLNSFSIFQLPLLVGLSRKKMLRDIAGVGVEDALNITTAANMIALQNGAKILRVHDVQAAKEAIKLHLALKSIS
ncbi:MAG: dihydropteroate synthase, partial [Bacteroidia bacterium]